MKKLLIVLAVLALLPAAAQADPIYVGQTVYFTDGPGTGRGGSYGVNLNDNLNPVEFYTFCVQLNETLYTNNSTPFVIDGISLATQSTPPSMPLTSKTAWLYTQFRNNSSFVAGDAQYSTLQVALWLAMGYTAGEISPYQGSGIDNTLISTWNTLFAGSGFSGTGDVKILNMRYASGSPAQDVLAFAVPEPGSMLLLGTGLLGLAAMVRRRPRK